jgi:hypothetical protein
MLDMIDTLLLSTGVGRIVRNKSERKLDHGWGRSATVFSAYAARYISTGRACLPHRDLGVPECRPNIR